MSEKGVSSGTRVRRLQKLIRILAEGYTTISQLCEQGERKDTIRRDVLALQQVDHFIKYFNDEGIVSFPLTVNDTEFLRDIERYTLEKQSIGTYIVEKMIDYGDTIFLDSGTTVLHVAMQLVQSPFRDVIVITDNLYIVQCLSGRVKELRLVGGSFDKQRSVLLGSPAYDFAKEGLKKSFISLTGLSYEKGAFCEPRLVESKRQAILASANLIVFIADHSKIGNVVGQLFVSFEELAKENKNYYVVTDNNLSLDERQRFQSEIMKFPEDKLITVPVL